LKEIILNEDTGFLVKPNDSNALAGAIFKLVESPNLRNVMGAKGASRQSEFFSLQSYRDSFTKLYKRLIK
jgi:glycosyltransferase involved in cell wall biosynthesis